MRSINKAINSNNLSLIFVQQMDNISEIYLQ